MGVPFQPTTSFEIGELGFTALKPTTSTRGRAGQMVFVGSFAAEQELREFCRTHVMDIRGFVDADGAPVAYSSANSSYMIERLFDIPSGEVDSKTGAPRSIGIALLLRLLDKRTFGDPFSRSIARKGGPKPREH